MSPPPPPPIRPAAARGAELCTVAASAPAAPPAAPALARALLRRALARSRRLEPARERAARFICALVRPLTSSACDCRPATCAARPAPRRPVAPVSAPRTACSRSSSLRQLLHTARYRRIAGFAGARSASFGLPLLEERALEAREPPLQVALQLGAASGSWQTAIRRLGGVGTFAELANFHPLLRSEDRAELVRELVGHLANRWRWCTPQKS